MTAFIYCHLKADNFEPFYVGIGRKKSRAHDRRGRNRWHKHVVSAHGLEVNVFGELPDWEAAQWWEKRWIKALKDAGYNLVNQTPGGDGGPTWTGRKHTDATKAKMSLAAKGNKGNLGRVFSEEHREKLSLSQIGNKKALGRKDSDETRAKKSCSLKGKKFTEEHRKKLKEAWVIRRLKLKGADQ
jgi:hypothetical protein